MPFQWKWIFKLKNEKAVQWVPDAGGNEEMGDWCIMGNRGNILELDPSDDRIALWMCWKAQYNLKWLKWDYFSATWVLLN